MLMFIPVNKLAALWSVFAEGSIDYWQTGVTADMVRQRIADKVFEKTPFQLAKTRTYDHAARIAWLCVERDTTPIELDVGCPCLNYYKLDLTDGNHRFAAAVVTGQEHIVASVAGEVNYAYHLFKAPRPEYSHI